MKRALVALAVLVASAVSATPASAASPTDEDEACVLVSVSDPNPEAPDNTMTGAISGGPVLQNGTLTCTIQVGGDSHDDANNGASASATGTNGVTFLAPTLVSYTSPSQVPVYLCDQFTDAGGTPYFYDDTTSTWVTSSNANCRLVLSASLRDPVFDPIRDLEESSDFMFCPLFALLSPGVPGLLDVTSTGDTYLLGELVWDCPPYEVEYEGELAARDLTIHVGPPLAVRIG